MIKKTCKTCEHRFGLSWHEPLPAPCRKCPSPEHPQHRLDRGLLEARVAELEAERDGLRTALDDARRGVEPPPSPPGGGRARPYLARIAELERERDAAIARAAEERAARCGLEEQLAEAERRRDDARAEAATRKTFLDSSIAALRQALNDRDLFAGRARRYRAALREANRGRKLARARAAAGSGEDTPPLEPIALSIR